MLTISHKLLFWRQATLWKISVCLSVINDLAYTATLVLSVQEKVFFVFESRSPSELGRMCIQVVLNILPNMWPHFNWDDSLCWIGGWVCIFFELSIDYKLSKSLFKARYYDCEPNPIPNMAAFAWHVRLVFRNCISSVLLTPEHPGHSRGYPENSVSFSFGKPLAPPLYNCY